MDVEINQLLGQGLSMDEALKEQQRRRWLHIMYQPTTARAQLLPANGVKWSDLPEKEQDRLLGNLHRLMTPMQVSPPQAPKSLRNRQSEALPTQTGRKRKRATALRR